MAEFLRLKIDQAGIPAKRYTDRRVRPGYIEIWIGR
jgi:hypothetical protein